jgi:hypothetical protein
LFLLAIDPIMLDTSHLLERELVLADAELFTCLVPDFGQVLGRCSRDLERLREGVGDNDVGHYAGRKSLYRAYEARTPTGVFAIRAAREYQQSAR